MMLSKRQFASAVGATETWVDNTRRLLRRPFQRTDADARWLGLVREMSDAFDVRLERAAEFAHRALELDPRSPQEFAASRRGAVRFVIDLERYHSQFGVALASALLDGAYHRGRPPARFPRGARSRLGILMGAAAHGVDIQRLRGLAFASPAIRIAQLGEAITTMLSDLAPEQMPHIVIGDVAAVARGVPRVRPRFEVCYVASAAAIKCLAHLLAAWEARPLDVAGDYPFIRDEQTVADSPVLALATRLAPIVLRQVNDVEFATLAATSEILDLGAVHALVPCLPALISAVRATRHRVPSTTIPELEAAAVAISRIHFKP